MMISRRRRRGQAVVLVSLALFAMCGLMGLAVDLGYSYWVKKQAQTAADSAALAAAYQALSNQGLAAINYPLSYKQTLDNCGNLGSTVNLSNACQYAQQNGFTHNGHNNHQDVTIEAGVNSQPNDCTLSSPTAPCINANYWVTVRTVETIPQLFSVLLGNTIGTSSARATAVIIPERADFSLIALNRQNDQPPKLAPPVSTGTDMQLKGRETINVPKGLVVASLSPNTFSIDNNAEINGPITARTGLTNPNAGGTNTFNTMPDGQRFNDPYQGLGQPPLQTAANTYAVMGGNLSSTIFQVNAQGIVSGIVCGAGNAPTCNGMSLTSGNYFPASCPKCNTGSTPVGDQTSPIAAGLSIGSGATITFADGGFGAFNLFGGLSVSGTMKMGAGEYVIVGGGGGDALAVNDGATIVNNGSVGAGTMFVVTGTSSDFTFTGSGATLQVSGNRNSNSINDLYPGLKDVINSNLALVQMAQLGNSGNNPPALGFGDVNIKTGFGNQDTADISGIDPSNGSLPANLANFAGVVFWQDQANSTIDYTTPANTPSNLKGYGYVDTYNCAGADINSPCTKTLQDPTSPEFNLAPSNPTLGFKGIIYQPRGAWINIGGSGAQKGQGITGALQIITGFVAMNGGGLINLQPPPIPLTIHVVALIE